MPKLYNLSRMTISTSNSTSLTVNAAVSGYLTFTTAGAANNDLLPYGIIDGSNSEVGAGSWNNATSVLTRNVNVSTNSNNTLSLSSSAQVFLCGRSQDFPQGYDAGIRNCRISTTAAANALTIALKTNAGNDATPQDCITIPFRNSSASSGDTIYRDVTTALSVTLANNNTMGAGNATALRLWILAMDNAGTVELAVINCTGANIFPLNEYQVITTVASSSNSGAGVFVSTTARSSLPFRILGFIEWNASGLTTAGKWNTTNFALTQPFGPGIKKPGDTVQTVIAGPFGQFSNTSSTYQSTLVTASITPTSAANPIRYHAGGNMEVNATGIVAEARMHRGATAIGTISAVYNDYVGHVHIACGPIVGFDPPNTTSSTTYTVKLRNSDNVTVVVYAYDTSGFIILDEIMA